MGENVRYAFAVSSIVYPSQTPIFQKGVLPLCHWLLGKKKSHLSSLAVKNVIHIIYINFEHGVFYPKSHFQMKYIFTRLETYNFDISDFSHKC